MTANTRTKQPIKGIENNNKVAANARPLEAWQDVVVDYRAADRIGKRALEAVADLVSHLVLLGRHDKEHAVALFFLADAPFASQLIAEILDGVALKVLQRNYHHLVAGRAFVQ